MPSRRFGTTLRPLISDSLYFEKRSEAFEKFQSAQASIHGLLARSLAGDADALRERSSSGSRA